MEPPGGHFVFQSWCCNAGNDIVPPAPLFIFKAFFFHFHPSTINAKNFLLLCYEPLVHQTGEAGGAGEAGAVPVPPLKWNKPRAPSTYRLGACRARPGEKLCDTMCAVLLVITGGEAEACQGLVAVGAGEALPVPGLTTVSYSSRDYCFATAGTLDREWFLITAAAVDVTTRGEEGVISNVFLAAAADEAVLVPLPPLVLHPLHSWTNITGSIIRWPFPHQF